MAEFSNFDVLKAMSLRNQDIRIGTDLLTIKKVKAGSQITIGIAGDVVAPLFVGRLRACLVIFDVEQFDAIKAELQP
jgi:hypothetical protein